MRAYSGRKLREEVYRIILAYWPIHITEICKHLDIQADTSNISRIKYHVDVLYNCDKIECKGIDRALVSWPAQIETERDRLIHNIDCES